MNLFKTLHGPSKTLYRIGRKVRRLLPRQRCHTFRQSHAQQDCGIGHIYVINLDRQPERWAELSHELSRVLDSSGVEIGKLASRYSAVDSRNSGHLPFEDEEVVPFYTLRDQLFVEPQPHALPDRLELDRPIRMSLPEVAVARSHIGVWRRIASGVHSYALVLEDDVWFHRGFAKYLDRAWRELEPETSKSARFDVLYLSYKEVKHGAPKSLLSPSIFRPVRGLWYLSGYVVSRQGAEKLLNALPCRGPIDLWMNHYFGTLDVRATRESIISQRLDCRSTNSYSILPALTKIGVLDCEGASLFHARPQTRPVFAFGPEDSGLSSLAMALSMLGYRCCSDLRTIPGPELEKVLAGRADRVFDAYVNVGSLEVAARALAEMFPQAKFFITAHGPTTTSICSKIVESVSSQNLAILPFTASDKWKIVCEHLKCAPPMCSFPELEDVGQRKSLSANCDESSGLPEKHLKRDASPWIVESHHEWKGIRTNSSANSRTLPESRVCANDSFDQLDTERWLVRDDTFAGNLALFRPSNVECRAGVGAVMKVKAEAVGVRNYSAASISSRDWFLFGKFETVLQASNVSGVVTGFFLHRDSPRQEIDIEIAGNRPNRLLVNVFYNPGSEGARFDYGYRGAPSIIELGFDASKTPHRFAIEWEPSEIRWLVDGRLVHRRSNWAPTPIPQLPMRLHINAWPTRSRELAGRLAVRRLPATAVFRSIALTANQACINRMDCHD